MIKLVAHAPVPLQLKRGGGDAFITEHSEDFVTLASSAPSPPGSTVEAIHGGKAGSVTVRVKVRGCQRQPLPDASSVSRGLSAKLCSDLKTSRIRDPHLKHSSRTRHKAEGRTPLSH